MKQPEASIVESSFTYTDALASTLDQVNHVSPLGKHDLVLDSRCTYHMTPFRNGSIHIRKSVENMCSWGIIMPEALLELNQLP